MKLPRIPIPGGWRRWRTWAGYPAVALLTFVVAAHFTFPYHRLESRIASALGKYYEVTQVEVGPGWIPGHLRISDLKLKTRPKHDGDKTIELVVDSVDVSLGLLALIGGGTEVDFEATLGEGEVEGTVSTDDDETSFELDTSTFPIGTIPSIKEVTGGVPLEGPLDAHVEVTLPKGKWKEAEGVLEIACTGCTIGDGVAKIRPMAPGQTNAFTEGGLTLPRLKLGTLGGKIVITKGVGRLEDFETKSPDGEMYLEGEIRFEDPFERSVVTAYMRFRSSDDLKKREPKMADMETMMGGQARRPDGYFGVSIRGPVGALRYVPSKVSPVIARDRPAPGARPPVGSATTKPNMPTPNRPMPPPPAATPPVVPPPIAEPTTPPQRPVEEKPPEPPPVEEKPPVHAQPPVEPEPDPEPPAAVPVDNEHESDNKPDPDPEE